MNAPTFSYDNKVGLLSKLGENNEPDISNWFFWKIIFAYIGCPPYSFPEF